MERVIEIWTDAFKTIPEYKFLTNNKEEAIKQAVELYGADERYLRNQCSSKPKYRIYDLLPCSGDEEGHNQE